MGPHRQLRFGDTMIDLDINGRIANQQSAQSAVDLVIALDLKLSRSRPSDIQNTKLLSPHDELLFAMEKSKAFTVKVGAYFTSPAGVIDWLRQGKSPKYESRDRTLFDHEPTPDTGTDETAWQEKLSRERSEKTNRVQGQTRKPGSHRST